MLTVDEALQLVEAHVRPLAPRQVPLADAAGLVLAADVASDVDSPPHDKALMDGYAVVSADRSDIRQVIEEIAAGAVPHNVVTPGTAARIMTGAPLPQGADAIVPIEESELVDDGRVRLHKLDSHPGQHVLACGSSMRAGDVVVRRGALVRPIEIAILAEAGCAQATTIPRPQVSVLSTGNELVPVDSRPAAGQIRNSNSPLLVAAARSAGATVVDLGIARDLLDELRTRIQQGLTADLLVLSGGVSAGKFDLVPQVLTELGVRQVFHKVALRPGKPIWFGVRDTGPSPTIVFGLPGNPVSSFICFELFVRPAIAALFGRPFPAIRCVSSQLAHEYQYKGGRESFLPARISDAAPGGGLPIVEILPWQGSADLATLAQANSLIRLGAEAAHFAAGATVEIMPI